MSGARQSETLAVVEQALAVYRQPARHAELLRGNGALPAGLAVLLRLAGGTEAQELDRGLAALAPESELRKAALFFVEEVLFRREASHYRVLGLNQDAAAEQIKEHHRLLMRLFHPDRNLQSDERREHFATRANLAYNTLRDAESRARYDETLKPLPTARAHVPRHVQPMPRRPVREPDSYWTVHVYPKLMRRLPQWVLAGTALVSVTLVGAVYLFNQPVNLPQAGADSSQEHVAASQPVLPVQAGTPAEPGDMNEAAGDEAVTDEIAARFESRLADAGQAASAVEKPAALAEIGQPALPLVPQPRQPAPLATVPAVQGKGGNAMAGKPVQAAPPAVLQKPAAPQDTPAVMQKVVSAQARPAAQIAAVPQAVPEPARALAAAAPAEPAPADTQRIELPDPNSLLARFFEAYEKGDMQTCMALLDDGMRAKPELRREYDALFRSTDLRHVKILSMNWSREGDAIRGEGQYRSTMMRKGETVLRSQGGQIRVELVRRGSSALINELQYIASSRS